MAEGRRGGDAGVNTPVISVKCTWAQLARRYYCSYAEALRAGNKWREISRFLFFFGIAGDEWTGDGYEGGDYWKGLF